MSAIDRRKSWARELIRRAPTAPLYGSEEFLALADGPEKVASVVKAAESYLTELEDGLARLRAECLGTAHEAKLAEDAEYVRNRDEWRRAWTGRGFRPDPAIAADIEREWREWVSA